MPKSASFDNQLLGLIFTGAAIAGLAQNAASGALSSLYISLHTADPTAGGDQTSNEATYAGYARAAVARSGAGWIVTGGSASPAAPISFGACTGGSNTITHWAIGTAAGGAGLILYSGTVSPNIAVSAGVSPQLTAASTVSET
jgi:hypothetical protein